MIRQNNNNEIATRHFTHIIYNTCCTVNMHIWANTRPKSRTKGPLILNSEFVTFLMWPRDWDLRRNMRRGSKISIVWLKFFDWPLIGLLGALYGIRIRSDNSRVIFTKLRSNFIKGNKFFIYLRYHDLKETKNWKWLAGKGLSLVESDKHPHSKFLRWTKIRRQSDKGTCENA